jgi:plastocyanin
MDQRDLRYRESRRRFMAMERSRRLIAAGTPLVISIRFAIAVLLVSLGSLVVRAQEDRDPPHPAHIHSGSCDDLGDIVYPLTDVALETAGEAFGTASAVPVEESDTTIDASLQDILAAPHAVNIHQSADAIQNYIACGDIGGRVIDGKLAIGLQELHGSGHQGVAILDGSDAATTTVTVYLSNQGTGGETEQAATSAVATSPTAAAAQSTAEPTAVPTAAEPTAEPTAASSANEVPVDIVEFSFSPDPVEVSVGDTVTWTNQGTVPHTATAEDRGVLQSGPISPGDSFSQVFSQAGEFPYFCEFHPNMHGTIIVK